MIDAMRFQQAAFKGGVITLDPSKAGGLKSTGFFGSRMVEALSGKRAEKTLAVKAEFLSSLRQKYGPEFADTAAKHLAGKQLLTATTVRYLLVKGDVELASGRVGKSLTDQNRPDSLIHARQNEQPKGPSSGGTAGTNPGTPVKSTGNPVTDLVREKGIEFAKTIKLTDKGTIGVLADTTSFVNNSVAAWQVEKPKPETVSNQGKGGPGEQQKVPDAPKQRRSDEGAGETIKLMSKYLDQPHVADSLTRLASGTQNMDRYTEFLNDPKQRKGIDASNNAANFVGKMGLAMGASQSQYPTRLELHSKVLMEELRNATPEKMAKLQGASTETLKMVRAQIDEIRDHIAFLTSPKTLENFDPETQKMLTGRAVELSEVLLALTDPDGPIQGFVAFASLCAANPSEARKLVGLPEPEGIKPKDVAPREIVAGSKEWQDHIDTLFGAKASGPVTSTLVDSNLAVTDPAKFLEALHVQAFELDRATGKFNYDKPLDADGVKKLAADMNKAMTLLHGQGNDWVAAKSLPVEDRQLLTEFRKRVVDGLIYDIRHNGGIEFTASSVGSVAITSDYDLTFGSLGSSNDVRGMVAFNDEIERLFGSPPGTVFDTNIYVADFGKVGEKLDGSIHDEEGVPFSPSVVFENSIESNQHVMSLLKMRRTMDTSTWLEFTGTSLSSEQLDGLDKAVIGSHYDEADAVFSICNLRLFEKLEEMGHKVELQDSDIDPKDMEMFEKAKSEGPAYRAMLYHQLAMPGALQRIAEDNPGLILKARNEIYRDVAVEVRKIDDDIQKGIKDKTLSDDAIAHRFTEKQRLTSVGLYFAAEAYHSAGAVRHIVSGLQGGNAKPLSVADLQASMLEQLGDARMHGHADNSVDFAVGSSKYLTRVFDGLEKLMTGKGLVPLERGEMEPLQDAASDCFRLLLGRSRTELGTPGDCGAFIKNTILACKKGEIKLSQGEADQLKAMLTNDTNVYGQTVPPKLKAFLLDVCTSKVGQTVTIGTDLKSEGGTVAKDLFRLGDDPHEFETRLNIAASLFDAAMVRQMKPVSDQEMLAYYKNRQPTNDNNEPEMRIYL